MANWKKIIVSGSSAELNQITASNGITGSFFGDGSGLTGVTAAEWDGTHDGNAVITGSLIISGAGATTLTVKGDISATNTDGILANTASYAAGAVHAGNLNDNSGSWEGILANTASYATGATHAGNLNDNSGSWEGILANTASYAAGATHAGNLNDNSGSWEGILANTASYAAGAVHAGNINDNSGSWEGILANTASYAAGAVHAGNLNDNSGSWEGILANTASYAAGAVHAGNLNDNSGSWEGILANTASYAAGAVHAGNLNDASSSYLTSTQTGSGAGFADLTVVGSVNIGGHLTVTGTTTTLQSTTIEVADPFIFNASGSTDDNVDGGLIVQSGSAALSGSAIYHDIGSHRWAVAKQVPSSDPASSTAIGDNQKHGFVVTVKGINLGNTIPHNPDNKGEAASGSHASASYGVGEIIIDTNGSDGNIWILGN